MNIHVLAWASVFGFMAILFVPELITARRKQAEVQVLIQRVEKIKALVQSDSRFDKVDIRAMASGNIDIDVRGHSKENVLVLKAVVESASTPAEVYWRGVPSELEYLNKHADL